MEGNALRACVYVYIGEHRSLHFIVWSRGVLFFLKSSASLFWTRFRKCLNVWNKMAAWVRNAWAWGSFFKNLEQVCTRIHHLIYSLYNSHRFPPNDHAWQSQVNPVCVESVTLHFPWMHGWGKHESYIEMMNSTIVKNL